MRGGSDAAEGLWDRTTVRTHTDGLYRSLEVEVRGWRH